MLPHIRKLKHIRYLLSGLHSKATIIPPIYHILSETSEDIHPADTSLALFQDNTNGLIHHPLLWKPSNQEYICSLIQLHKAIIIRPIHHIIYDHYDQSSESTPTGWYRYSFFQFNTTRLYNHLLSNTSSQDNSVRPIENMFLHQDTKANTIRRYIISTFSSHTIQQIYLLIFNLYSQANIIRPIHNILLIIFSEANRLIYYNF